MVKYWPSTGSPGQGTRWQVDSRNDVTVVWENEGGNSEMPKPMSGKPFRRRNKLNVLSADWPQLAIMLE
jgi:hypothetical protein